MKKSLLSALYLPLLLGTLFAQQRELYHKVSWDLDPAGQQAFIARYAPDHFRAGKTGLVCEMSASEIAYIRSEGYTATILQEDMQHFYAQRLAAKSGSSDKADLCIPPVYNDPAGFSTGSLGGYLTYAEILQQLDDMAAQYPSIFKARSPVDTFHTHQGRPIYWVKISDNAQQEENEPRLLYNAHIHAREAISGMQLLYFMWYLLENYDTDPEIKYIIDHTELYFIPVLNPDGVLYNESTAPGGGGMHRKNMRNTGGSNPGVDLNRNFGMQWGTSGVSWNTGNDTYPGPSAFSEPETQAFKWFAEYYDFSAALTHHSYSNLLLYPYGYANVQTPDDAYFGAFTEEMVSVNHFSNIQSVDLYPASGDTDDWLYEATGNKPRVLALTPESGSDDDGFWPAPARILPMCRANLKMNTDLPRLLLKTALVKDRSPRYLHTLSGYMAYDFSRFGMENGTFTVSLTALDNAIQSTGMPTVYNNPVQLQVYHDSISYTLAANLAEGTTLRFLLRADNGIFTRTDTLYKIYGQPQPVFSDDASALGGYNMTGGSWATTTNTFVSAPSSITDSPSGNYANNQDKRIVLANPFSLAGGGSVQEALLSFQAKWDLETGYDYVQVEISTDNGNSWTPLCGRYTHPGTANQAENEPLYDGTQASWVQEEISLNAYTGQTFLIRFRLVTDQAVTADGFYFDDLQIKTITSTMSLETALYTTLQVFPNPAGDQVTIQGLQPGTPVSVISIPGQTVYMQKAAGTSISLPVSGLASGLYFIKAGNETVRLVKK